MKHISKISAVVVVVVVAVICSYSNVNAKQIKLSAIAAVVAVAKVFDICYTFDRRIPRATYIHVYISRPSPFKGWTMLSSG